MATDLFVGQSVILTAVFTDNTGKVQPLPDGHIPVWAASSTNNVNLTPAQDGMTCQADGIGAGDVNVTSTVEGDPTPGVDTIVATILISVKNREDTVGTITAGTPFDTPVPTPAPTPAPAPAPATP